MKNLNPEAAIRASRGNREAADYLQRARESIAPPRSRPEFAAELGQMMGIELTPNTYWSWETGRRQVPAAAIFGALALTNLPVSREVGRAVREELRLLWDAVAEIRSEMREKPDGRQRRHR